MTAAEEKPTQNQSGWEFAWWRLRIKNGIKNAKNEALDAGIHLNDAFEWAFTGLVFFGVLFEVVIPIVEPSRARAGAIIGNAWVAAGLAIEMFAGNRVKRLQGELTDRSNKELGKAKKDASAAHERAAHAERDAAEAQERTAKLERRTSDRRVSPERKALIADAVGSIEMRRTSLRLLIRYQSNNPEAHVYAHDLGTAFNEAGVPKVKVQAVEWTQGFGLHFFHGPRIDLSKFACALTAPEAPLVPIKQDMPVIQGPGDPWNLYLWVGPKPPPEWGMPDW